LSAIPPKKIETSAQNIPMPPEADSAACPAPATPNMKRRPISAATLDLICSPSPCSPFAGRYAPIVKFFYIIFRFRALKGLKRSWKNFVIMLLLNIQKEHASAGGVPGYSFDASDGCGV
jgi:hypothetical protein